MARETQKEKIARLETELAQAINQRDAAIADALASNSKLNAKHDVSDSPMYQSLLLDREQWKRIAKNRQDQIKKNELRYDELLTMYKDLEQQLKGSQAMQADPENQQTAYKELQTEHERLKTEYETVKTLCERTLEAYNAIQNDYNDSAQKTPAVRKNVRGMNAPITNNATIIPTGFSSGIVGFSWPDVLQNAVIRCIALLFQEKHFR